LGGAYVAYDYSHDNPTAGTDHSLLAQNIWDRFDRLEE
jgi:hypothetical protein